METHLNISQAKATFSAVVERAAAGEDFIITKMGKPYAKVTKIEEPKKKKLLGLYEGHDFKIADDFDEWPEDIARAFGMID
ncbi:MAG: type II toxin-antitoxin system prevent-host-death family antitoxin [Alphaproteobacteria bacterium]|jgi:prevent-host-death family protein|nr:type II toxin-antitoxin system prevent-host-death family antitoxin [Thalassospira sp.]MCE2965301.1 type II toxin-antitoxin system prevent-host-death family antitoxin [Alphaproteobacteria bacterium]